MSLDYLAPDYLPVYQQRAERLERLRAKPSLWPGVRAWYRENPADLIDDWGMTYDPRNADVGLPTDVPFLLFPRQREFVVWAVDRWKGRRRGLAEKSRDMGVSWLSVSLAAALAVTHDGLAIGFGSRDEDSVDKSGDPDSLFWKLRYFLERLPPELSGGFVAARDSSHMRVTIPATGSVIKGDAGDNIGRGGRAAIYFVDEAAALKRPELVEAALSQTTNCRIDISTPRGLANPFAQRRFAASTQPEDIFTFHWRQDPRKDDAWYQAQVAKLDPLTVAQEIDLDYSASADGVLIPAAWVQSAIDAHVKLGWDPTGQRVAALDVADEGADQNALCVAHGTLVEAVPAWSGKGSDIFGTTQRAFQLCDDWGVETLYFDADGLGAGVRGDARVINDGRRVKIAVEPFRGSGPVQNPKKPIPQAVPDDPREGRKGARRNEDFLLNAKSQGWWGLRVAFERTHKAVTAGGMGAYAPDDLISLSSRIENLPQLQQELSQATYSLTTAGRVQVNKAPKGTRSPNRADAVMIRFAPRRASWAS